ncbi:MAG: tRNA epoxyqueuosine(34) reductase QueG, partial [Chloroflexota bacterium]
FARPAREPLFRPVDLNRAAPPLLDLIGLDEAGFHARFGGTPVMRAKRRGLLRNVAVALGNWGAPQAIPALIQALHDPEPLIRGHAAWALGQMDDQRARAALAAALKVETDEMVIAEIRGVLNSQGD